MKLDEKSEEDKKLWREGMGGVTFIYGYEMPSRLL